MCKEIVIFVSFFIFGILAVDMYFDVKCIMKGGVYANWVCLDKRALEQYKLK